MAVKLSDLLQVTCTEPSAIPVDFLGNKGVCYVCQYACQRACTVSFARACEYVRVYD